MPKEIAFSRVATKLDNLYSAHKTDNCVKLWQKEFHGILSASEAKRLFELFAGELMLLEARTARMMVWAKKANPANWTPAWCKNTFEKYGIQTKRVAIHCHTTVPALVPKPLVQKWEVEDHKIVASVVPATEEDDLVKTLQQFTDEQLQNELDRRAKVKKLAIYAEKLGCQLSELPNVINDILDLI